MTAISDQHQAERDAAFAALGIEVEVSEGRAFLFWRGYRASFTARLFTDAAFPGLAQQIQVRMIEGGRAEVKIGGRVYDVLPPQQGRTIKIPTEDT